MFGEQKLMGLAANSDINTNTCFISIPNSLIISLHRVNDDKDLKGLFASNPNLFTKTGNPNFEILMLSVFLIREKLLGEKSFWYPYLEVMNTAEWICYWDSSEIN